MQGDGLAVTRNSYAQQKQFASAYYPQNDGQSSIPIAETLDPSTAHAPVHALDMQIHHSLFSKYVCEFAFAFVTPLCA